MKIFKIVAAFVIFILIVYCYPYNLWLRLKLHHIGFEQIIKEGDALRVSYSKILKYSGFFRKRTAQKKPLRIPAWDVPRKKWPKNIASLSPEFVYVKSNGVFIVLDSCFVCPRYRNEGVFILKMKAKEPRSYRFFDIGYDYKKLGNRVYWHRSP